MPRHPMAEEFFQDFGAPYLRSVLEMLFEAYPEAHRECVRSIEVSELIPVRSVFRRALIERGLRECSPFHGVTRTVRSSEAFSWNHTVVSKGRSAMTQSAIPEDGAMVRKANFRSRYAGPFRQQYLFPELEENDLPDNSLYGILTHGASPQDPTNLAFAKIVLPTEDMQSYQTSIDLFVEFPDIVQRRTTVAVHPQMMEPMPQLRDDVDRKAGEA